MAKQSNHRRSHFIPASLLAASLLTGCTGQTTDEYIHSAESYIKQNDRPAAVIELKNALKQEPKNAEARRLLGESYLAMNQAAPAEKELLHALKLGAQPISVYPSLIRSFNLQNKYQEIVDQDMPKGLSESDEILASVLRGVAYLSLDKAELARLQFEVASQIDNSAPFSQLGQAYYASAEDNIDQALQLLDSLLAKETSFTEALILKAGLLLAQKDYKQASSVYITLAELDPKNLSYKLQLAKMYLQQGLYDETRDALKPVMKRFPKHPYSNLIVAELEFREGNFQASKDAAAQVLLIMEGNTQAKYLLGLSSFKLNDYEQAHRYLSAVEAVTPKQHPIRRTIATIEYQMGYLNEAAETLLTLNGNSENEAKLLEAIGIKQVDQKDFSSALDNLLLASELAPDNYELKARIGVLKLAGKDDSGLADLDAALSGDPSLTKIKLYQALYFIENKEYAKALAMAKEWQAKVEKRVEGYNLEGLVYLAQKQFDKAQKQFEKSVTIESGNRVARNRLANIAINGGDFEAAKQQFLALLVSYPEDTSVHISLARIAIQLDKKDEAKAYFDSSLQKFPKADNLRVAYVQLLAHLKDYDAAMQMLEQVEASKKETVELLIIKADLLQAQQKTEQARLVYQAIVEKQPKVLKNWLKLLANYRAVNDSVGLAKTLEAALKQHSNSLALKRLEIEELIQADKFELALKKIDALRAKPELLNLADQLDSAVYFKDKKFKKAVASYQKMLEREPTEARTIQLSSILLKTEQPKQAKSVLEAWISTHKEAKQAKQALAIMLHSSAPDEAVAQYRALIKEDPNNVPILNNLAWTLAERGEVTEAVKLSKHAASLAPKSAAVLDTYGFSLLAAKEFSQAVPVLKKASQLAKGDLSIKYHLAQAYYNNGQKSDAKTVLQQVQTAVTKIGTDFPEKDAAMKLLKKL